DQGGIAQEDAGKAAQHGQQGGAHGVEGLVEGFQKAVLQEVGRLGSEAFVEGLAGDGVLQQQFGGVGEVIEGSVGVVQEGEDQGLEKDRSGELAGALAKARFAGQLSSGVVKKL